MKRTRLGLPLLLTLLASAACSSKESNNTPATGGTSSSGGTTSTTGGSASGVSGTVGSGGSGTSTGGSATGGSSPDGTSGGSPSTPATGGTSSGGSPGTGGSAPAVCPTLPTGAIASKDIIQFNDDGGWCWYQDERVVVDTKAKKAVIGSVATGSARNGQPEAVIYDFATGMKTKYNLGGKLNPDDHNAPGFVVMPDGKYVAMWATHRENCNSYYGVFDGTQWSSKTYDWTPNGCEWEAGMNPNSPHKITYANPWYLSSESKIFSAVRSISTSPAMLSSSDGGNTWSLYGRLTATPTVGYVAGYYKYWGNGPDRIDFVATQAHPR